MAKATILRILHSPFGLQLFSLTFLVLFVTSFRPSYFGEIHSFDDLSFGSTNTPFDLFEPGFIENTIGVNTAGLERVVETDQYGNVVEKIVRKKRDKKIKYTVKKGDRLEEIAHRFGLKVSTLLWANDLTIKSAIKPNDKLIIPPTDGIYYVVKKGETLSEIVKLHDIELAKVRAYNHLNNDTVKVGQSIFLPEAQKIFVQIKPTPKTTKTRTKSRSNKYLSTYPKTYLNANTTVGSTGISLIRPTKGVLTQGFHRGHYALDIANAMNTPIYAAAAGTVVREAHTGWNYGYGRYIVIDHGNGVQTLYAHNNVTKVSVGEVVKQGQLIALMGNTGNVYGRTGIHSHFELRIRGRKVDPRNYFH